VNRKKELTLLTGSLLWSIENFDPDAALGRNIEDLFGDIPMNAPVVKILDGEGPEEFIEAYHPASNQWFRSRLLPLYSAPRTSGKEGEKCIDGVIGISMDVTGTYTFLRLNPVTSATESYQQTEILEQRNGI
jgi:hypothetical protein